jgi:hypothetical protein
MIMRGIPSVFRNVQAVSVLLVVTAFSVFVCAQSAPTSKTKAKSSKSAHHANITPGPCPVSTAHGRKSRYDRQACPDLSQCSNQFNVDDYLNGGLHPKVCVTLTPGKDEVIWTTNDAATTIRMTKMTYYDKVLHVHKNGHPFVNNPPFAASGPGQAAHSGKIRKADAPSKQGDCYQFKSFIEVTNSAGKKCIDPHIYTSCDGDITCAAQ